MAAIFTENGKLLETEQEISITELPKLITEYISKNYAGYKIAEGLRITEAGTGAISYEAEIKKDTKQVDLIFDASGNFLKKEGSGN